VDELELATAERPKAVAVRRLDRQSFSEEIFYNTFSIIGRCQTPSIALAIITDFQWKGFEGHLTVLSCNCM